MKKIMMNPKPYATTLICICIISYWVFVALHSSQSLYETQHSRLLLGYGAVDGQLLDQGSYWRIIISQFTHVKFFHMIGNLVFILLIGTYVERRFGVLVFLFVYFLGGAVGQYASVLFNPDLVSSGASQALCSLASFSLIQLFKDWQASKITAIAVLLFISIQCGLDLYFAERLKEGHTFGFITGVAMSLYMFWKANIAIRGITRAKSLQVVKKTS